ncbi:hypothetical protein JCM10450v2_006972 [Rhodotorula kratochvilovae]
MATRRAATVLRSARIAPRSSAASPSSPSPVALGTAYELATASFLAHAPQYRLQGLVRVGGAGDQGDPSVSLDNPPPPTAPSIRPSSAFPVLVQCKAESARVGPSTVRELEGTLLSQSRRAPSSAPLTPHIGILVALSGFSEAAIRHARASALPLALVHLAAGDVGEMVRSQGREGGVRLVSASRNRALEQLLRRAAARDAQGRIEDVEAVVTAGEGVLSNAPC